MREHPQISGFTQTGVPKDEGQHLQSVYEPARTFGGPGKYIYDQRSYMNEHHDFATEKSAKKIFEQWGVYFDVGKNFLIEKSPPNLIRTRFLQALFPRSKFIVILRHPLAVAYATQKWSKTSIKSLVQHTLMGYEIFQGDLPYLSEAYVIRYEDFVRGAQAEIDKVYEFLEIDSMSIRQNIRNTVNEKYFKRWREDRKKILGRLSFSVTPELERRTNNFGYSINQYNELLSSPILGAHSNALNPTEAPS